MVYAIETFGLTKHYSDGVIGVEDLSLEVEQGEIYGFLGSNGAGKTTTIRMLANLLHPTRGSAQIFGKDVVKQHIEICRQIGYLPSSVQPHKYMTGENFLDYMGNLSGNCDKKYRKKLLERFEFSNKDLKRKIKKYSSGMARKIALIQTFQHRPKLMIMDEPTEGLDPVMQHTFYELLREYKEQGGTVFLSSHHLAEVEQICDRAGIIRNGYLVAVKNIHDLMKQMTRTINISFKNKINPNDLISDDWEIIENSGYIINAKLTGNINKIIKLLSKFEIEDLSLPNPSLQDVFLDYYNNKIQDHSICIEKPMEEGR